MYRFRWSKHLVVCPSFLLFFFQGHQISKEELTFRMSLFVAMMKAEREGTDEADIAVSKHLALSGWRLTCYAHYLVPLSVPC